MGFKETRSCGLSLSDSRQSPVAGSCEHSNQSLGSIRGNILINCVKSSAPRSYLQINCDWYLSYYEFGFQTVSFDLYNVAFSYRQHVYLIEVRINCCPLSESCCWNVARFFLCPFWYLSHFMCVHMKCEEIIQVFFAPLASKDKKFTASLQS
jgi:hypothetical protein